MNRKDLVVDGISKYRYRELLYLCRQYQEMKAEVERICYDPPKQIKETGGSGGQITDKTPCKAQKSAQMLRKISAIELSAQDAGGDLWQYVILNVCTGKGVEVLRPPCGRNNFYKMRNNFFGLLDRRLDDAMG